VSGFASRNKSVRRVSVQLVVLVDCAVSISLCYGTLEWLYFVYLWSMLFFVIVCVCVCVNILCFA